jgi:DNA mismatch repair ATPase MutS
MELQLVRPSLTTDNLLHISAGYHLLHASRSEHFVSTDTKLGEQREGGQVHVATGPNGVSLRTLSAAASAHSDCSLAERCCCAAAVLQSGKTVYLQHVGIIAYMALCGCFVPAASAVVGLLDGLYSCMATTESVSSDVSSFCQEAWRIAFMQQHATARILVVLDKPERHSQQ